MRNFNFLLFAHFTETIFMHNNEFSRAAQRFLKKTECILSIIFWIFIIYGFDDGYLAASTVACAVIHELGHLGAVSAFSKSKGVICGRPDGLRIVKPNLASYRGDFMIFAAGPAANILSAAAASALLPLGSEFVAAFVTVNMATAIANLLPVRGHDGYGMLKSIIALKKDSDFADAVLGKISFVLTAFVCFFSLYLMEEVGEGYWVFGVFYFSMLCDMTGPLESEGFADKI